MVPAMLYERSGMTRDLALTTDLDIEWPLPPGEAAAIAVSGGADSFALLHWAWKAGHPVVALTVDHGLREGSAAEAQAVRTWCSERNVSHETLIWRGEKPKTGIQAAAREARYRLLCQACERMGIEHLLTAHTADDQAETVFMRLRRGAGRGLAGMPRERRIAAGPGELITLHRPMLSVRGAVVRGYAKAQGLPFADDPSNEDDRYERVRVRAVLAALEQQELLTVEALCRTASHVAQRSEPQIRFSGTADGAILVADCDQLEGQDFTTEQALDAVLTALGAAPSRAERSEVRGPRHFPIEVSRWDTHGARLGADASSRVTTEMSHFPLPAKPMTAGGVMIAAFGRIGLAFIREPAALLGRADGTPGFTPVPAPPGSKHLYDRRFIVEVPEDAPEGLHLRPLGQLMPRDIATSTLPRQRIATLPCLAEGNRLAYLPKQATGAVSQALAGWKACDDFLSPLHGTFRARSLLAERFAGDVIRF